MGCELVSVIKVLTSAGWRSKPDVVKSCSYIQFGEDKTLLGYTPLKVTPITGACTCGDSNKLMRVKGLGPSRHEDLLVFPI